MSIIEAIVEDLRYLPKDRFAADAEVIHKMRENYFAKCNCIVDETAGSLSEAEAITFQIALAESRRILQINPETAPSCLVAADDGAIGGSGEGLERILNRDAEVVGSVRQVLTENAGAADGLGGGNDQRIPPGEVKTTLSGVAAV